MKPFETLKQAVKWANSRAYQRDLNSVAPCCIRVVNALGIEQWVNVCEHPSYITDPDDIPFDVIRIFRQGGNCEYPACSLPQAITREVAA